MGRNTDYIIESEPMEEDDKKYLKLDESDYYSEGIVRTSQRRVCPLKAY